MFGFAVGTRFPGKLERVGAVVVGEGNFQVPSSWRSRVAGLEMGRENTLPYSPRLIKERAVPIRERMPYPELQEYMGLASDFDIIPVRHEVLADLETPVSVLRRFCDNENAFLLESMEGGETWGRYSFVGVDPELLLEADHSQGRSGCLEVLRDEIRGLRVAETPGLPRFVGGIVGFAGYESMCEFERMPDPKAGSDAVQARSRFLRVDQLLVFDNVRNTLTIVVCTRPGQGESPEGVYGEAIIKIEATAAMLKEAVAPIREGAREQVQFESNLERESYTEMVRRAKEYIVDGDIIQVVLSQRFSARSDVHPFEVYRALRLLNPSPYTFYLKVGDQTLVGSSPEVMVRLTGDKVELRPIAGTRPRGQTLEEDDQLAEELLADEKERAEHIMLVDLGRNDVGRVSEPGSVVVTDFMIIERYSHVMHLVSHVEGSLKAGCDAYDVMAASFPAGTLSGAPKIRAMEIIHELEPEPRGAYGGAVGYISYDGNMDMAITIRTLDMYKGIVSVQAGAGIVYDSDPDTEYDECCHKARGMQKAVQMAAEGM
jgi:anthranilate synthase component 1